ncbi:hypothetical protein PAXRUDRAFT_397339 [Paxillus rubicundulus Ve08.2h10]|uniref:Unplaced genomic scaffold scaffold_231, whole genome shotgun sequence n=1 Tax=Paxillus rubicundulus Ve08.2h10 TaxID=930991 RepID=A0A0D0E8V3_9AGAM|nr:hypothetical protein PAXRUDRAFT_397339 [Paxillus rubicundulus Ve08.2h10]
MHHQRWIKHILLISSTPRILVPPLLAKADVVDNNPFSSPLKININGRHHCIVYTLPDQLTHCTTPQAMHKRQVSVTRALEPRDDRTEGITTIFIGIARPMGGLQSAGQQHRYSNVTLPPLRCCIQRHREGELYTVGGVIEGLIAELIQADANIRVRRRVKQVWRTSLSAVHDFRVTHLRSSRLLSSDVNRRVADW